MTLEEVKAQLLRQAAVSPAVLVAAKEMVLEVGLCSGARELGPEEDV